MKEELNNTEIEIILKIMNLDFSRHKVLNISDLARLCGVTIYEKTFQNVKNILKEKNILEVYEKNKTSHIITKINKKELKEYIPTIPILKKFNDEFIIPHEGYDIWKFVK